MIFVLFRHICVFALCSIYTYDLFSINRQFQSLTLHFAFNASSITLTNIALVCFVKYNKYSLENKISNRIFISLYHTNRFNRYHHKSNIIEIYLRYFLLYVLNFRVDNVLQRRLFPDFKCRKSKIQRIN